MTDLLTQERSSFAEAVITGLSQRQKVIPARYFYDRRGSELFEAITRLPEYYPTRTETALLQQHAGDLARLAGKVETVVEFGSGSSAKTPLLLGAVRPAFYVPIDISGDFLRDAADAIAEQHEDIQVIPVTGDFTRHLRLPTAAANGGMLGFFPGSTIGNFAPRAAVDLLRSFAATLGPRARLVIGVDTRKNPRLIEAAYDDSAGVTAAFNLNLLHRINRELGGSIEVEAFEHRAEWNDLHGRIEMHLVAQKDVRFSIAGRSFTMRAGETIHTENSYKYRLEEARLLARTSGWEPMAAWTDADGLFSLHMWVRPDEEMAP